MFRRNQFSMTCTVVLIISKLTYYLTAFSGTPLSTYLLTPKLFSHTEATVGEVQTATLRCKFEDELKGAIKIFGHLDIRGYIIKSDGTLYSQKSIIPCANVLLT